MSYCIERTKLLADAGKTLAEELLPKPFKLWHSDHSTGIQMTIIAPAPTGFLHVWRGSIWHSDRYEFNDRDHIGGLQPDFAFAREAIDKYFADVRAAVETRNQQRAAARLERETQSEMAKRRAIEDVRAALSTS